MQHRFLHILFVLVLALASLHGQTPFPCEGQVIVVQPENELIQLNIATNNGLRTIPFVDDIGEQTLAMGFRRTDGFIYAINPLSRALYRIDANGQLETLGTVDIDPSLVYLAGDVTNDGNTFVVIGADPDERIDKKLFTITLENGTFATEEFSFENLTFTPDIAFHPVTGIMYGFDSVTRGFYSHVLGTPTIDLKDPVFIEHNVEGVYFDAFGVLYGFGTAFFGVISGLFEIDQQTGETDLISTSGLIPISDVAACPYSVEFNSKISPEVTFPCSDLTFDYSIANQSGATVMNVVLEHNLPDGYTFNEITNIPFGGVLDQTTPENVLRITGLDIPIGIHEYSVSAFVDDIPAGVYKSQARLDNLPSNLGSFVLSNDPASAAIEDSTRVTVNRIEEDSLFFEHFLCSGASVTLDARDFGSNLQWSTGETSQQIEVNETALVTLIAASGCEELVVNYDIVAAQCPFSIELGHTIEPDTFFGCSQVTFNYILENDTGEERIDVGLIDELPEGFTFVDIIDNPYESNLSPDIPPNIFQLEDLVLKVGIDTISILVEVLDINPGTFRNKALMTGLPQALGPTRTSDDPSSQFFPDSTTYFVRGVPGDSLLIDTVVCVGTDLVLDASPFGEAFIWEDGSTSQQFITQETGDFAVAVITGCDTASVIFQVEEGENIQVTFSDDSFDIHQGETIQLQTNLSNGGDSLRIDWTDPTIGTLSCDDCLDPTATPISDVMYTITVQNETCMDSDTVFIIVDETRRIYIPTAFSPNQDGINDFFFFQSPDPGTILSMQVFNRWGGLVYEATDIPFNNERIGWNGNTRGEPSAPGPYIWQAQVEFIDGEVSRWSGTVSIIE